jgi:hypothetical protein
MVRDCNATYFVIITDILQSFEFTSVATSRKVAGFPIDLILSAALWPWDQLNL